MRPVRRSSVVFAWVMVASVMVGPAPVVSMAHAQEARLELERPREFGYRIGDTLHVRVAVDVPPGYELEGRSLGDEELPDWLELRERAWEAQDGPEGRRYDLRFVFQVFYAPDSVTRQIVPERRLVFRSTEPGAPPLEAAIPEIPITIAPITSPTSTLAPDYPVPPPSAHAVRIAAATLAILVLLTGLAVLLRRRSRRNRRFRIAHRRIAVARDCTEAALELHRALESESGSAVFADDLDVLIARWPEAERIRPELERFFALSESIFYENGGRPPRPECLERVREVSRRLAEIEGGG